MADDKVLNVNDLGARPRDLDSATADQIVGGLAITPGSSSVPEGPKKVGVTTGTGISPSTSGKGG